MMTTSKFTIAILLLILLAPGVWAQTSLIETVEHSKGSLVAVHAENSDLSRETTGAAIDPATGKMVALSRIKAAKMERYGAGIIIEPSGIIATNLHTIKYASRLKISLHDGTTVAATILKIFPDEDFALLQIRPPFPLLAATFADSDQVKLGDDIVTVGNSELLNQTISGGRITGLGTSKHPSGNAVDVLKTNINLYKGDSGGPLLDKQGRLIGLMVAKNLTVDRSSYAIPSNKIKIFLEQYLSLKKGKSSPHP